VEECLMNGIPKSLSSSKFSHFISSLFYYFHFFFFRMKLERERSGNVLPPHHKRFIPSVQKRKKIRKFAYFLLFRF